MSVYRYSTDAGRLVARKAANRSAALMAAAIGAGLGVSLLNGIASDMAGVYALGIMVVLGTAIALWQWKKASRSSLKVIEAIEVELTPEMLDVRHPMCPVSIRPQDVTQLRYMSDGILVQTRDLRQSATLGKELDGFAELSSRLETWVPANVPRTRSSAIISTWATSLVVLSLALMIASLTVTTPAVAVPLCLITSLLLLGCMVWVWRSKLPGRTKLLMSMSLLPLFALLSRAYILMSGVS